MIRIPGHRGTGAPGVVAAALMLAACGTSVTGEGPGITGDPPPSKPSGVVAPSILTTSLPVAMVGQPYFATLSISGGAIPINWTVTGGSLPAGITLDRSSGNLSGTPTVAGTFQVEFTAATPAGAAAKLLPLDVQ